MAHEPTSDNFNPFLPNQLSNQGRKWRAIKPGTFLDRVISKPLSPMAHIMASAESGIMQEPVAATFQALAGQTASGAPTTAAQPSLKMALAITFCGSQP